MAHVMKSLLVATFFLAPAIPGFSAEDNKLMKKSIFRIDGQRMEKYSLGKKESVWIPSIGFTFSENAANARCEKHTKPAKENMMIRENVSLSQPDKDNLKAIEKLIKKCKNNTLKQVHLEPKPKSKVKLKTTNKDGKPKIETTREWD